MSKGDKLVWQVGDRCNVRQPSGVVITGMRITRIIDENNVRVIDDENDTFFTAYVRQLSPLLSIQKKPLPDKDAIKICKEYLEEWHGAADVLLLDLDEVIVNRIDDDVIEITMAGVLSYPDWKETQEMEFNLLLSWSSYQEIWCVAEFTEDCK